MIKKIFKTNIQNKIYHQFYNCSVTAGFPSPADDYLEDKLDLNEYLIKHPAATFFFTCGWRFNDKCRYL